MIPLERSGIRSSAAAKNPEARGLRNMASDMRAWPMPKTLPWFSFPAKLERRARTLIHAAAPQMARTGNVIYHQEMEEVYAMTMDSRPAMGSPSRMNASGLYRSARPRFNTVEKISQKIDKYPERSPMEA